jgi:hypothetical protein
MDWFYAIDGQQRGPVTETQLDELLSTGTINRKTLLWRSGMPGWQALEIARPTADLPPAPPVIGGSGPAAMCVECRRPFMQSDMVFLNKMWVCAECKPVFLQRMMEGSAPAAAGGELVWRSQRQFILRSETPMPDRCVRCNAPANGYRLKRQLYWHPPAYYLLILISILVYAIVAICIRKKARIHIALCETHRAVRKWTMISCWLAAVLGLGAIIVGAANENGLVAVIGILLMLGGLIWGVAKVPTVSAAKIEKDFVWVKGGGREFLDDLPEWTGPA